MGRSLEAIARAKRNYLLRHPERRKATIAKYYAKNKEKERARLEKWQKDNPERYHAWRKQYKRDRYAAGLDTPNAWIQAHPERVRNYKANTRAKRKSISGRLSPNITERLLDLQQHRCAICQKSLIRYHLDHIMPVGLGGTNEDSNMQILCPRCNQTKSSRNPIEFMREKGKLL